MHINGFHPYGEPIADRLADMGNRLQIWGNRGTEGFRNLALMLLLVSSKLYTRPVRAKGYTQAWSGDSADGAVQLEGGDPDRTAPPRPLPQAPCPRAG